MLKISAVICLICLCYVDALPHCKVLELPEGAIHRNTINVIYTMESSCKYCARKASILPNLKASLRNAGINAHFIVALSNKSGRLSGLSSHLSINKRHLWKALGEENNHFYVIDRCGRMVYEIINPWSSLQMPFLRGAIIATQFSHPCGLCPQDYTEIKEENLKIYPAMVEETQPHTEETPLGIVMRLRHKHHGDPNVYNHIVMTADGKPGHHRHLPHESNNEMKHKPTFSLGIPEDSHQASEASTPPNEAVSDSSVSEKQLSVKNSRNSIKNLANNGLRMANENQLSLDTSDTKDDVLYNSASSDTKYNFLVTSAPSDMNKNPLVSSTLSEQSTEPPSTESTNTEKSQEIDNSQEETKLYSSFSEITTEINSTDEEISGDYYDEGSEEPQSTHEENQLNSSEMAEKEHLKEHYGRILDWIKYDY